MQPCKLNCNRYKSMSAWHSRPTLQSGTSIWFSELPLSRFRTFLSKHSFVTVFESELNQTPYKFHNQICILFVGITLASAFKGLRPLTS